MVFWGILLYCIAPLLLPVTNAVGIQLSLPGTVNLETIAIQLLSTILVVIAILVVWSELWARYNTFLHKRQKHAAPFLKTGIATLAGHFNVLPNELATWQKSSLLIIHFNDHGVIRRVNI